MSAECVDDYSPNPKARQRASPALLRPLWRCCGRQRALGPVRERARATVPRRSSYGGRRETRSAPVGYRAGCVHFAEQTREVYAQPCGVWGRPLCSAVVPSTLGAAPPCAARLGACGARCAACLLVGRRYGGGRGVRGRRRPRRLVDPMPHIFAEREERGSEREGRSACHSGGLRVSKKDAVSGLRNGGRGRGRKKGRGQQ